MNKTSKTRWSGAQDELMDWLEEEIDKCDGNPKYQPPWSLILNSLQTILSEIVRLRQEGK